MYSADRRKALEYTVACLEDMHYFEQCQKTLIVDGRTDYIPMGFEIINVPRFQKKFSWAKMWDAGVYSARYEKIIYLDSDRLLPKSFIEQALEVKDKQFLFTSKHFHMLKDIELDKCQRFLELNLGKGVFLDDDFVGQFRYEPRFKNPLLGPGKNVMSGSVVFTKKTYHESGGVDPWYCGHGAFADTDYHFQTAKQGCEFIDLEIPEIHYHHLKIDNKGEELDHIALARLGLDNFIYYCKKWELPLMLAEDLATKCFIKNPVEYVQEKFKSLYNTCVLS